MRGTYFSMCIEAELYTHNGVLDVHLPPKGDQSSVASTHFQFFLHPWSSGDGLLVSGVILLDHKLDW